MRMENTAAETETLESAVILSPGKLKTAIQTSRAHIHEMITATT